MVPGREISSFHKQEEASLEMTIFARMMQGLFIVLCEILKVYKEHQVTYKKHINE